MKRRALTAALAFGLAACAGPRPAPEGGAATPPGWNPDAPTPEAPAPADTSASVPGPPTEVAWEAVPALVLPEPPWAYALRDSLGRRAVDVPRLTRLLEAGNGVTDQEAWLARNDFDRPGDPASPARPLPFLYRGEARIRVVESGAWTLGVYGPPSAGRYLLVAGDDGTRRAFDFAAYRRAPSVSPGDEAFVEQDLVWAAAAGGWLYVAHAHRTYAVSSGGMNGYVTALDLASGDLRWRSRPRVANAATFALVGDALVTGYGFTAEPDFLYVLDRFTGEVIEEERVRTAPEWLLIRGDRLFVRAYDADYVYALR